eukprot:Skav209358  [mRNA]  locus=scaffold95:103652:109521:- [translate_table: standard]
MASENSKAPSDLASTMAASANRFRRVAFAFALTLAFVRSLGLGAIVQFNGVEASATVASAWSRSNLTCSRPADVVSLGYKAFRAEDLGLELGCHCARQGIEHGVKTPKQEAHQG